MTLPKHWRWMTAGAVAVVLIGLSLKPTSVAVETGMVSRDSLRTVIAEEAQTRARERYVVAAPITGRVTRTRVIAGSVVKRGDILTTMTPAPLDARLVSQARANVRAAESRIEPLRTALSEADAAVSVAARELERMKTLLQAGAISPSQLEQQELQTKAAQALRDQRRGALEAAHADAEAARAQLLGSSAHAPSGTPVNVTAPTNGTVLRVLQESETVAQAGTPLVELADANGLEIVVNLLTEDAVQVHPGNPIRLTGWGGDSVLTGDVLQVDPSAFTKVSALGVEEQRVHVIGNLATRPTELGVGFRLQAEIVTWSGANILTVPTTAIFRRTGKWFVFAVINGRAQLRELEIGHKGIDRVEVLKGLQSGERVILFPSDLIADGVRVSDDS